MPRAKKLRLFLRPFISMTNLPSAIGAMFLFLYIHKILRMRSKGETYRIRIQTS